MKTEEIIKLLEKAKEYLSAFVPTSGHNPLNWVDKNIDQAIALLQKPEASKFTAKARAMYKKVNHSVWTTYENGQSIADIINLLPEACTRLDALQAENKAKDEEIEKLKELLAYICELDRQKNNTEYEPPITYEKWIRDVINAVEKPE